MSSFTTSVGLAKDDALTFARIHQRAFPEFFLSKLGVPFLVQFYRSFVDDPTAIAVEARDGSNQIVGMVVGTTHPRSFFKRLLLRRLPGFLFASVRAAVVTPRALPRLLAAVTYRGGTPAVGEGALLSSICVDPAFGGAGVGRDLISRWREVAGELGSARAYLTTDAENNERVNQFYVSDGWILESAFKTRQGRSMNLYRHDLRPTGRQKESYERN